MTARHDEATRLQALQAGCVSLLCKPFSAAKLIEAIEPATGDRPTDGAQAATKP
jgi:CheY-like chemotaxis protein